MNAPWDSIFTTKGYKHCMREVERSDACIPKVAVKSKNRSEWLSKENRKENKE